MWSKHMDDEIKTFYSRSQGPSCDVAASSRFLDKREKQGGPFYFIHLIANATREAFTLKFPRPRGDSAKPLVRQGLNSRSVTERSEVATYTHTRRRLVGDPNVSRFSSGNRGHGFRRAVAFFG